MVNRAVVMVLLLAAAASARAQQTDWFDRHAPRAAWSKRFHFLAETIVDGVWSAQTDEATVLAAGEQQRVVLLQGFSPTVSERLAERLLE